MSAKTPVRLANIRKGDRLNAMRRCQLAYRLASRARSLVLAGSHATAPTKSYG